LEPAEAKENRNLFVRAIASLKKGAVDDEYEYRNVEDSPYHRIVKKECSVDDEYEYRKVEDSEVEDLEMPVVVTSTADDNQQRMETQQPKNGRRYNVR